MVPQSGRPSLIRGTASFSKLTSLNREGWGPDFSDFNLNDWPKSVSKLSSPAPFGAAPQFVPSPKGDIGHPGGVCGAERNGPPKAAGAAPSTSEPILVGTPAFAFGPPVMISA